MSQFILLVEMPGAGLLGSTGSTHAGGPQHQLRPEDFERYGIEAPEMQVHNSGWNYLFVDGHVENLLPEETKGSKQTEHFPYGYWSNTAND